MIRKTITPTFLDSAGMRSFCFAGPSYHSASAHFNAARRSAQFDVFLAVFDENFFGQCKPESDFKSIM